MPAVAIVGASTNRKKYGNKAVRAYIQGGWTVYPINARADTVEGCRAYKSLADVPVPLDRIVMYVPPEVGLDLLDEIAAVRPAEFFLNPGSESEALVAEAEARGLNPIQACAVVNLGLRPEMFPDA